MKQKALIVWGGWDGHEPDKVAAIFNRTLKAEGFEVRVSDSLESFADQKALTEMDLIIPIWTMGEIDSKYVVNISEAVANGTGLAGCHGGMCDAFRKDVLWQFLTGGNWVAHPGGDGVEYPVNIRNSSSSTGMWICQSFGPRNGRSGAFFIMLWDMLRAYLRFPKPLS